MDVSVQSDTLLVIDNFLDPNDLADVRQWFHRQEFVSVHDRRWEKVWRLHDGQPLGGMVVHSARTSDSPSGTDRPAGVHIYPTAAAVDRLIEALERAAPSFDPVLGRKGFDWEMFTARAFLYPQGSGLSWHCDGRLYTGSFTWYAHSDWNCLWGGELLLADVPSGSAGPPAQHLENHTEDQWLARFGRGRYVAPTPNRLVVIRGDVTHRINPVLPAAGARVRASISGFFVRPPRR